MTDTNATPTDVQRKVSEIVTRGVFNEEIHRRSALPLLEAVGYDRATALEILWNAEGGQ